jgi:hypothetical protein
MHEQNCVEEAVHMHFYVRDLISDTLVETDELRARESERRASVNYGC